MGCARPGTRAPWRREAKRRAYEREAGGAEGKTRARELSSRGLTGSYPNVLDRWKLIGLASFGCGWLMGAQHKGRIKGEDLLLLLCDIGIGRQRRTEN